MEVQESTIPRDGEFSSRKGGNFRGLWVESSYSVGLTVAGLVAADPIGACEAG